LEPYDGSTPGVGRWTPRDPGHSASQRLGQTPLLESNILNLGDSFSINLLISSINPSDYSDYGQIRNSNYESQRDILSQGGVATPVYTEFSPVGQTFDMTPFLRFSSDSETDIVLAEQNPLIGSVNRAAEFEHSVKAIPSISDVTIKDLKLSSTWELGIRTLRNQYKEVGWKFIVEKKLAEPCSSIRGLLDIALDFEKFMSDLRYIGRPERTSSSSHFRDLTSSLSENKAEMKRLW
jgi:hypothetical protein